ncbi:next to BRCA1 gene 1 protein isoform X2 [Notechis scutatus]|uniref:Next to BRCA1 gene 1 protein isoform X2 n=1 Tax=Notechis scutatus TaxID=8663 RepID=A0A6J1VFG6_9SAUR|nr:next to BRCA1 gene 1 protein isoform X2 [Notechis scutatus]
MAWEGMANAERGTLGFAEVHSSDVQDLLGSPIYVMDPQVNFNVTFQGNKFNFLVSSKTTWADMEAMVKVSFELKDIQIKYLDEEHDEVSINSAEEYQEAVKIAMKHGNQLQMNVYELRVPSGMSSRLVFGRSEEPFVPEIKKKLPIAPTLIKDKDTKRKNKRIKSELLLSEVPPEWFTSYLEKFREQVVQDTVKVLEQKLDDKLFLTNQLPSFVNTSRHQIPASSLVQGSSYDWLLSCNNCQNPIVGIRYQCSVCPTYNICELCEAGLYFHDSNHVFLKLRRPTLHISDTHSLEQLSSSLVTSEKVRFQKQVDKHFLKAEKQRLRGEKQQRKAEAQELQKQLKLHQKFKLWDSVHTLDHTGLADTKSESLHSLQQCPVVSTLSAAFVDENLPDGTHLPPNIIFMKHWRMRNTGNITWSSDTKLKFMWGNITLMSSGKKDVIVPSLLPGEEGVVSVEFKAPGTEGTYTSHWRLSHKEEQFGPRIWCSIVVDSSSPTISNLPDHGRLMPSFCQNSMSLFKKEERASEFKGEVSLANRVASSMMKRILSARELYIPSLDLLTAQDLLSFELLDINIVQELEQVPRNTPVDSIQGPSPYKIHDCTSLPKTTNLDQKQEANEKITYKLMSEAQVSKGKAENSGNQEEGEEDMSGTQFVCETVIRSLTLDAAPDHQPPQKKKSFQNSLQTLSNVAHCSPENNDSINPVSVSEELEGKVPTPEFGNRAVQDGEESKGGEADSNTQDEVNSQASSFSEDYIVVLPECFDISRPLGESMYSSALSQSNLEKVTMAPANPEESHTPISSTSDTLITSQTLDEVSLTTPQSGEPRLIRYWALTDISSQETTFPTREEALLVPIQMREELQRDDSEVSSPENVNNPSMYPESSRHSPGNSLAGGLVKGALSVAASAYKALFVGQASMDQALSVTSENQMTSYLTHLHEMGFCDRHLNLHLLQKHKFDMNLVVIELLQLNRGDRYENPY